MRVPFIPYPCLFLVLTNIHVFTNLRHVKWYLTMVLICICWVCHLVLVILKKNLNNAGVLCLAHSIILKTEAAGIPPHECSQHDPHKQSVTSCQMQLKLLPALPIQKWQAPCWIKCESVPASRIEEQHQRTRAYSHPLWSLMPRRESARSHAVWSSLRRLQGFSVEASAQGQLASLLQMTRLPDRRGFNLSQ